VTSARPTIYLFDIDGTILLTGGAGRRALERAFGEVTGRTDACAHFSFGGMTDLAIVRQALEAIGREVDADTTKALLDRYVANLREEVALTSDYVVMPAVREVVEALRGRPGAAVGLGTGNLRVGAEVKLARGDLWKLFAFGGFGCDHEERGSLLALGAERGATLLGVPRAECRVVVIGDTTRDVAAARAIGAECVAVGTGGVSLEVLQQAGADAAFPDLSAPGVLEMLIGT
jgi:phosphoglycolate phosphatase-like HAD superfamily hydrolase